MGWKCYFFWVDSSLSVFADNRRKDILVLGEGPEVEAKHFINIIKYFINITKSSETVCLSLHYCGSNSLLYTNIVKTYQFKVKNSKVNSYPLCLCNIWKDITVGHIKMAKF